jgi:iron complex outermembrane receptor protein
LNYKFSKGIVKGLGIGVGMYNRSNTIGLYALQDYPIPGYTTIDAALNYRIKKVTLGVNVNNLTNAVYFVGGVGDAFMFSGAPRNFRASIAVAF